MKPRGVICFLLFLAGINVCTSGRRRLDICSGGVRCIWLNDLLKRRGVLPLHGHLESYSQPNLYCYSGVDKMSIAGLEKAWSGVVVSVFDAPHSSINVLVANSSEAILNNVVSTHDNRHDGHCTVVLSPYDSVCVGVRVMDSYIEAVSYSLDVKSKVLPHLPVLMGVGVALVFAAHSLSRSMTLYYGGGITVGVLASVLVLLYVFSRFVPKKNILGLGIFAGGWALFISVLYWFMDYAIDTALNYWQYLAVYAIVAAVVSFAVLYRVGPITNARTFNLIQWTIQGIGLALVYCSTQMQELSLALCGATLLFYLIPIRYNPVILPFLLLYRILHCVLYPLIVCLQCLSFMNPLNWFRAVPVRQLLTMEEYEEQGRVETQKGLSDLKRYCQDLPTREAVDLMSRLKDTNRFTGFLNGRDHITMEEQVGHDWTFIDDSSDETDDDSGDDRGSPQSSHLSSSVDSSHPSFDSSPVRHRPPHSPPRSHRPPHSPPRSHHPPNTPPRSHAGPTLGYNSPYRPKPTDRRMPYSSPSKSRTYYNTTY